MDWTRESLSVGGTRRSNLSQYDFLADLISQGLFEHQYLPNLTLGKPYFWPPAWMDGSGLRRLSTTQRLDRVPRYIGWMSGNEPDNWNN